MTTLKCQSCGRPAHDLDELRAAYHRYAEINNRGDVTRDQLRAAREQYFELHARLCAAQVVTA